MRGKMRTRLTPNTDTFYAVFSGSIKVTKFLKNLKFADMPPFIRKVKKMFEVLSNLSKNF